MLSSLLSIPLFFSASVAAQSVTNVVCVAGQCLEGYTNSTLGATLSASGVATSLLLLPGQYTSTTNPQVLHDALTSSGASLSPYPGFSANSTPSLPLNLELQSGIATYPSANFSGAASFIPLSTSAGSSSKQLSSGSFVLSSNVWAAVSAGTSNNRAIFWDTVPDIAQLPGNTFSSPLTLLSMQSSACSPPCAGAGLCSMNGTCVCPTGFAGASCESCAAGFFGPTCAPCPAGCKDCDQGISGTGKCLAPIVSNLPSSCNCVNGECGSNGQCSCLPGWTAASNGTACAQCAQGYFLDSSGNCEVCQLGCSQCASSSGDCITCKSGFTQDANDATKCIAVQNSTSSGTVCPAGGFNNGTGCVACSPLCKTCTGPTSNDCIVCAAETFSLSGSCVQTNTNGVCQNTTMVANNNKNECDTCPSKCTTCEYSSFTTIVPPNGVKCTGCLPGFVLSNGACVESCPSSTFLSLQDNLTCTTCDSSCSTCAGSSTFCLSCANSKLASNGTCVSSCPSNTFSSSGSCLTCHPDCATCNGSSFNQCSSCNSDLPVLTNGRCLATCSQSQYFDTTSSSCQSCDSSCSSCSGAGSGNCLACADSSHVLRGGSCVAASCSGSSSVIPGLGLCLSDLVQTSAKASGTSSLTPLPSITGLTSPVSNTNGTTTTRLAWWEILLMALGCAFIFMLFLIFCRRRMRKKRAQATAQFASAKNLHHPGGWRMRLVRFGERLFGHRPAQRWMATDADTGAQDMKLEKLRAAEEARHDRDLEKLIGAYEYSRHQPSPLPSLRDYDADRELDHAPPRSGPRGMYAHASHRPSASSLSTGSMYTQLTGVPRRTPEPRQPVRNAPEALQSRFSDSTYGTRARELLERPKPPTPAQEYAISVTQQDAPRRSFWLKPSHSGGSNNPFRR